MATVVAEVDGGYKGVTQHGSVFPKARGALKIRKILSEQLTLMLARISKFALNTS